jgi:hypothetical protein
MLFTSKFPPTAHDDRVRLRESDLKTLVNLVLESILPWAVPGDPLSRARGLEKILISAIDLDSHMNEQWAVYMAIGNPARNGQPRYGFEFDGTMVVNERQDIPSGAEGLVKLVIAPTLTRWGTVLGENYRTQTVIERGRVLVSKKKEQHKVISKAPGRITKSLQSWRENS